MGILRFLLAVSVITAHAGPLFGSTMLPGNYAVEAFFMISGFYMSLVLSEKYQGKGALAKFYSNRFIRLYPTYLLVAAGTWLWFFFVWWWRERVPSNSWMEEYAQMDLMPKLGLIFANWTMIGNDIRCLFHFSPHQGFMVFHDYSSTTAPDGAKWAGDFGTIGQAWSVGLEIWFYMAVPWLARLRTHSLIAIGMISMALKIWLETGGVLTYFFFPAQLVYFVIGMLARQVWSAFKLQDKKFMPGGLMIALLSISIILFPFVDFSFKRWVFYAIFALSLPSIFDASMHSRPDRWLGNLSYPIYMVHMLVLSVVSAAKINEHRAVLTLLGTLLVSAFLQHFIEDPLDRWRQNRIASPRLPAT